MAKTNNPAATTVPQIQPERVNFHKLIAANPNYFGNIASSPFPPVVQIQNNTSFEEVTCIGFNPVTNLLEAVIQIKRPNGYGGDPCAAGTFEYVRFFLNYGLGWEDAGLAAMHVHDIPNQNDCAKDPENPPTSPPPLTRHPKPNGPRVPVPPPPPP